MYQFITLKNPIPSCAIYGLKFNEGNWEFVYAVKTPIELKPGEEYDLVVYEYISDLYLKRRSSVNPQSVNVPVRTLEGYLGLLERQRLEDIRYRKEWCARNPGVEANTVELDNRDYDPSELKNLLTYVSGVKSVDQNKTIFIAV